MKATGRFFENIWVQSVVVLRKMTGGVMWPSLYNIA